MVFLLVYYLFFACRKVVETGSLYHFSKKARDSKLLPESSFLGGVIPTLGCHSYKQCHSHFGVSFLQAMSFPLSPEGQIVGLQSRERGNLLVAWHKACLTNRVFLVSPPIRRAGIQKWEVKSSKLFC